MAEQYTVVKTKSREIFIFYVGLFGSKRNKSLHATYITNLQDICYYGLQYINKCTYRLINTAIIPILQSLEPISHVKTPLEALKESLIARSFEKAKRECYERLKPVSTALFFFT